MNTKKIIIFILIIGSVVLAFYSMRGLLTPYVSFKEAIDSGDFVQVIGKRNKSEAPEYKNNNLIFKLEDREGTVMKIMFSGPKPLNFEHAAQVVALGKYNKTGSVFESDKILVKCPSKYKKEK